MLAGATDGAHPANAFRESAKAPHNFVLVDPDHPGPTVDEYPLVLNIHAPPRQVHTVHTHTPVIRPTVPITVTSFVSKRRLTIVISCGASLGGSQSDGHLLHRVERKTNLRVVFRDEVELGWQLPLAHQGYLIRKVFFMG